MFCSLFFSYQAPWQPVAIPAAASHLISLSNFDPTNKLQLQQIAHHNAQILRQFKGLHPPVTQYHNPFPVFPPVNTAKHVLMSSNSLQHHNPYPHAAQHHVSQSIKHPHDKYPTAQNLISSSSNVAQTVMPHYALKSYGKPSYFSNKPVDFGQLKYFNNIATTSKMPNFVNPAASSQNFQIFSTTSRVPLLR